MENVKLDQMEPGYQRDLCADGLTKSCNEVTQQTRTKPVLLTIGNKKGDKQCGTDDEGGDGDKPLLGDGLFHAELKGLAGEEESIDAHSTREDQQREADHHRDREA